MSIRREAGGRGRRGVSGMGAGLKERTLIGWEREEAMYGGGRGGKADRAAAHVARTDGQTGIAVVLRAAPEHY